MTEAEALDLAAKAICRADGQDWEALSGSYNGRQRQHDYHRMARAHAKTIMENAALKAEIERLRGHAVHSLSCSLANYGEPVECTCGLTALIKEIEGDWR